jgi:hypothetical protein
MNQSLAAWIDGVGLIGPGLADWANGAEVLAGRQAYAAAPSVLPAPALLPPAERRRSSRLVRLALAVGLEAATGAGTDAAQLATVFSASSGDGHNCHALCETLASSDRSVSPTRFHNSVHNTAAGYWGIATGAMAPSQVLCAYDASFGAGLLEALVQVATDGRPVLLICYDAEYPEPLHAVRPVPDAGGIALLLSPVRGPKSLARIEAALDETPATPMADPELEQLRTAIPALRGLPLLAMIATCHGGPVALDYLPPLQLALQVAPC